MKDFSISPNAKALIFTRMLLIFATSFVIYATMLLIFAKMHVIFAKMLPFCNIVEQRGLRS